MKPSHPHPPAPNLGTAERPPLENQLVTLINAHGPLEIGDFMAEALGHPQNGYYMTHCAIGKEGDFITAPEISQIFGELIGAWLIQAWHDIGAPSAVNLIELGPGRGTLLADILRTAKIAPAFRQALKIYLLETSARLRYAQKNTLADYKSRITWVSELGDIPQAPTLIIANEFFDCLPIRQFICSRASDEATGNKEAGAEGFGAEGFGAEGFGVGETGTGEIWQERRVGLQETSYGKRLCFVTSPLAQSNRPPEAPQGAKKNDIFEISLPTRNIIRQIATRFKQHKGRALIIDYGHLNSAFGDTLQAVRQHQFCHPLDFPGDSDITAHVDFEALGKGACHEGLIVDGPVLQGAFLNSLGAQERLEALCRQASHDQNSALRVGVRRLTHFDEMGSLFKVICLSSKQLTSPAGFTS